MKTYEYNVVKDVSTLSTIPEKALNKLNNKVLYCISDALVEAISDAISTENGEDFAVDLDLGIGKLSIGFVDNSIKYKFTPSKDLETSVKQAVLNEQNLLEDVLDKSYVEKIENVYKELI